jgi:hypothetical protein
MSKTIFKFQVLDYDVPLTVPIVRARVRKEFEKNRNVNDVRAIDMMVVKVNLKIKVTHTQKINILIKFILFILLRVKWNWLKQPRSGSNVVTL